MGTTSKGLPYPEPTDPVAAGADAIKALAQAIKQPLTGVVSVAVSNATTASQAVTFPAGYFTSAPTVTVTPTQSFGRWLADCQGAPSTSGFTCRVFLRDASAGAETVSIAVGWIAVGT